MRSKTIPAFCEDHGISRSYWYKMVLNKTAPRTMQVGTGVRISEPAEEEWVRERESAAAKASAPKSESVQEAA